MGIIMSVLDLKHKTGNLVMVMLVVMLVITVSMLCRCPDQLLLSLVSVNISPARPGPGVISVASTARAAYHLTPPATHNRGVSGGGLHRVKLLSSWLGI